MKKRARIGINADARTIDGNLELLKTTLEDYATAGFEVVEIGVHGVDALYGGLLSPLQVERVSRITKLFDFSYTVHGVNTSNLMNSDDTDLEREVALGSLEFAAAIGARVFVQHCGRYVSEERLACGENVYITDEMRGELLEIEKEGLLKLASEAEKLSIIVCLENLRPYKGSELFTYAENPLKVVEMIKVIDHPNLRMTLDIGHAYMAANCYGFDFLDTIRKCLPYVRHIHAHDNFGRASYISEKREVDMLAHGRGDMHAPLGWGTIPWADVFDVLGQFDGTIILEIGQRYRLSLSECLETCKKYLVKGSSKLFPIQPVFRTKMPELDYMSTKLDYMSRKGDIMNDYVFCESCGLAVCRYGDRYCDYCSDDGQALKPNIEMEQVIEFVSRYLEEAERLAPEEALDVATIMVSERPAWQGGRRKTA
jgi:sugar phosphate isomerase/epimerase